MISSQTERHMVGLVAIKGWAQQQLRPVFPCSKSTCHSAFQRMMCSTCSVSSRVRLNSRSSRWSRLLPRRWIRSRSPCERCSWSACLSRKRKEVVATWQTTRLFPPCDFRSRSMMWRGAARSLWKVSMGTQSCSRLSSLSSASNCTRLSSKIASRVANLPMERGKVRRWPRRTPCRTRTQTKITSCASASTLKPAQSTRSIKYCLQTSMPSDRMFSNI